MQVAEKIEKTIRKMPEGTTFKYKELGIAFPEYSAAAKAIERLIKKKIICRASTGVFYKPQQNIFGSFKPKEEELLKPYLFEDGKRIAYITGTSLYNKMGLTTQVPKNIKVASRGKRIITKLGSIQVNPVKSYAEVNEENYSLMELLDVLKDFTSIPDLNKEQAIRFMLNSIKLLPRMQLKQLIALTLAYPPRARAFMGALLQQLYGVENKDLKKSINPLTHFDLGMDKKQLSTLEYWNIC